MSGEDNLYPAVKLTSSSTSPPYLRSSPLKLSESELDGASNLNDLSQDSGYSESGAFSGSPLYPHVEDDDTLDEPQVSNAAPEKYSIRHVLQIFTEKPYEVVQQERIETRKKLLLKANERSITLREERLQAISNQLTQNGYEAFQPRWRNFMNPPEPRLNLFERECVEQIPLQGRDQLTQNGFGAFQPRWRNFKYPPEPRLNLFERDYVEQIPFQGRELERCQSNETLKASSATF